MWNCWFYRCAAGGTDSVEWAVKVGIQGYDSAGIAVRDGDKLAEVVSQRDV